VGLCRAANCAHVPARNISAPVHLICWAHALIGHFCSPRLYISMSQHIYKWFYELCQLCEHVTPR
jgi:hypothetical protein